MQGCIALGNKPMDSQRSKHIVREKIEGREIELVPIGTEDQLADLLTKGVRSPGWSHLGPRCKGMRRESDSASVGSGVEIYALVRHTRPELQGYCNMTGLR